MPQPYKEFVEQYNYSLHYGFVQKNMGLKNYVLDEMEKWLSDVKYYNCNRELGMYLAYYVAR